MKQEQYIKINKHGNKFYYKDKRITIWHRLDGPAVEGVCGSKEWYVDDKPHRIDGPAIKRVNGDKLWYVDGKRHRTDGPAVEWSDGIKEWFFDGKQLSEEQFLALSAPTLELTLEDIADKFGVDVSKMKIVK